MDKGKRNNGGTVKFILVVGARPNFMKAMPICQELEARGINYLIYHSGQHYDYELSKIFEDDFNLSKQRIHHETRQKDNPIENIQETILKFKNFLIFFVNPTVLVFGDVNTAYACALATKKRNLKLVHVEAGLRSFDITMPEEHNRIAIDHLSDMLFTTCYDANQNLIKEGISEDKFKLVGNLMIDTLIKFEQKIKYRDIPKIDSRLNKNKIITVTMHRPSNVDDYSKLCVIVNQLRELTNNYNVIFSMHPRTRKRITEFNLCDRMKDMIIIEPLGYIDFLSLVNRSFAVITDSGGLQEETSYLGIPCVTVRDNTERPITISDGTNKLVNPKDIGTVILNIKEMKKCQIVFWDGLAAKRIISTLLKGEK